MKSLAASWAFVHFGRQLVHNKCDSGEYCENKNTVVFTPKMMSESSCYKRDKMILFAFHNVFPVVRLFPNTYRRGPVSVAALLLSENSSHRTHFWRGSKVRRQILRFSFDGFLTATMKGNMNECYCVTPSLFLSYLLFSSSLTHLAVNIYEPGSVLGFFLGNGSVSCHRCLLGSGSECP